MVGEVGNKANTAQLVVGVKVVAELGKKRSAKLLGKFLFWLHKKFVRFFGLKKFWLKNFSGFFLFVKILL